MALASIYQGEEESSSDRNWCDLTPDIVIKIANKVPLLEYLSLRFVCPVWYSLIPSESFFPTPWLFLNDSASFCCLVDHDHPAFSFSLPFPTLLDLRCIGSQDGFLILVDVDTSRVVLFNPLTGSTIDLPTPTVRSSADLLLRNWKFTFSHNTVVACDIDGDNTIITYKGITTTTTNYSFRDVVFHEGKLYGIDEEHGLLCFDINNGGADREPEMVAPWMMMKRGIIWSELHLVSLGGDLLTVERFVSNVFVVSRFCRERSRWIRVRDLGGWSLFMSEEYCVGVCDKEVRANCIYFTERYCIRNRFGNSTTTERYRVRVFDMRDRSIRRPAYYWGGDWKRRRRPAYYWGGDWKRRRRRPVYYWGGDWKRRRRPAYWGISEPPFWFIPSWHRHGEEFNKVS